MNAIPAFTGDDSKRGVYLIKNNIDGTIYIGSTVKSFRKRWKEHVSRLRLGDHGNIHLQRAYNRDGESAFECSALECVENVDQILAREQFWLDHYEKCATYNMCPVSGSRTGSRLTPEHRAKISQFQKQYHNLPHIRRRQSVMMTGRNVNSKEHYERLAQQIAKTYPGLIAPDGTIYRDIVNMAAFCRDHGLSSRVMHQVANGKVLSFRGWTAIDADRTRMMEKGVFGFISPDGAIYEDIANLSQFSEDHGLIPSAMSMVHAGKIGHHRGWRRIGGEYKRCFAFVSPDGIRHENILNLAEFSRQHGLNKDAMSLVHNDKRIQHRGWTKG